jgi:hypothetical protein
MLNLNQNSTTETITITGKDDAFKNTPFADSEFSLTMKPITQTKYSDVKRKHTTVFRGGTLEDDPKIIAELFNWSVIGWEGIAFNGEEIECSKENKLKIIEKAPALADAAVGACFTATREKSVVRDEAEKN